MAVNGNGTNQLDISATIPYDLLRHLEESGQAVPGGIPAPQGFLEPFHFHVEYVVVPEPATLTLLVPGAVFLMRRKIRSRRRSYGR